ncbi:MAG: DUF2339 domain-containing protein [Thermogutta sp.]
MFDFEIIFFLIFLAVLLSAPALLAVWMFSRAVRRRHQETLAILTALTQSVQALRRELRMPLPDAHVGPPVPETAEAKPSTWEPEKSREEPARAGEAKPPGAVGECVEAELVPAASEGDSQAESTPSIPAPAREVPISADAGAADTLKRIGNWLLFGQERAPSGTALEVAIAANWLLRIGMLILVLGIAFFLKYSIDRGWIGPFERVLLGTATGLAMVTAGTLLLGGRYRLLAHGLQGGGIVTLYLSVFAAAVFLKLIDPVPAGFAGMACVTALAWFLALVFGSPLTAVIGIAGGYITPVVLPSDEVQFVAFYTYLTIVGLGVLGISLRKNWPQLNILSFLGTYLLAVESILQGYSIDFFWTVLSFLTLFFVLFSTIVFLASRFRSRANLFDLGMLWLNALFFFGLADYITRRWLAGVHSAQQWTALIPLGLAAFYSAHTYFLLLRRGKDVVLFHASVGLASVFVAIAVPMVLSGDWITFAWAAQSLVMLWLALRIDSRFLRSATWVLFAITAVRFFAFDVVNRMFLWDWRGFLAADIARFLPRLTALGGAVLCVALAARLLFRRIAQADPRTATAEADISSAARVLAVTAAAMLFVYATQEIRYGVQAYYPGMESGAVSIWWALFAITLTALGMWKSQRWVRAAGLVLFAVVTYKVFFRDLRELDAFYRIFAFVILGLVILSGSVLYLRYKTIAAKDDTSTGEDRP